MIKCHLSRMMGERKLKISDVSRETGIHRNMLTLLYYEKAKRVEFDVLEKLCRFFRCQIGEILEFKGTEQHNKELDSQTSRPGQGHA